MNSLKYVKQLKYFLISIDPIHIGTGGYRLGSVDNTIIRDASSKLPKIPGSSISGVVKSFYPYVSGSKKEWECITSNGGCGKSECIVCFTYGYSKANESSSKKGKAQFFDANIIFFPVFTTIGTKWITTPEIIYETFGILIDTPNKDTALISNLENKNISFIAIGWLSMNIKENEKIQQINEKIEGEELKNILNNLIVVNNDIFSFLVNNNLEVRTSTRIDPKTGTVKQGALFTYEAIPRGTVFSTEITFFDYSSFENKGIKMEEAIKRLKESINLLSVIGLGGMNTRGFGRLKLIERGE